MRCTTYFLPPLSSFSTRTWNNLFVFRIALIRFDKTRTHKFHLMNEFMRARASWMVWYCVCVSQHSTLNFRFEFQIFNRNQFQSIYIRLIHSSSFAFGSVLFFRVLNFVNWNMWSHNFRLHMNRKSDENLLWHFLWAILKNYNNKIFCCDLVWMLWML